MAASDVSITAANVVKGSTAIVVSGVAGATITAGQTIYSDTANGGVMKLADADNTSTTAATTGIALHGALNGQPIAYVTGGAITIGGTLTAGKFYAQSNTAGAICLLSDSTTGWWPCVIGYASSTTVLQVGIVPTGVQL